MALLDEAARKSHERYRASVPPVTATPPALAPGGLALLFRPRSNKLFVRSSGPYLILSLAKSTVTLQNLATGITLEEHVSNVRPLRWHDTMGE